jgi:hypothetical protein
MKTCSIAICFVILVASVALAQERKAVPPPPKPADDGPSLEITMKFIQEKLKDMGEIHYAQRPVRATDGGDPQWAPTFQMAFSEVVADPSTCYLTAHHVVHRTEADGFKEIEWTFGFSFREVERIEVISLQDRLNREHVKEGHPEIQEEITPAVFNVDIVMTTGKTMHELIIGMSGEASRKNMEHKNWLVIMPDEDMANRVAKAMVHAVELCGGGGKPEPF